MRNVKELKGITLEILLYHTIVYEHIFGKKNTLLQFGLKIIFLLLVPRILVSQTSFQAFSIIKIRFDQSSRTE